jgi:hypothetical protein
MYNSRAQIWSQRSRSGIEGTIVVDEVPPAKITVSPCILVCHELTVIEHGMDEWHVYQ